LTRGARRARLPSNWREGSDEPIVLIHEGKTKVYLPSAATMQLAEYEGSGANGVKYTSDQVWSVGTKSHIEFTASFDSSLVA
jgi:hypothetical protein